IHFAIYRSPNIRPARRRPPDPAEKYLACMSSAACRCVRKLADYASLIPPTSSRFFNGEPRHAQSTSGQLLGTAINRRGHRRNYGSAADHRRGACGVQVLTVVDNFEILACE